MIKFIIKSVVFLILLVFGLNFASSFFKTPHRYYNTIQDYKKVLDDKKEIDIAFYGSSHVFCTFNPIHIDSATQARSFNFGNDAQRMVVTKFTIKETFKDISPKLVVIDMYASSIRNPDGIDQLYFQKHSYAFFDISYNKISSIMEVFPTSEALNIIFPALSRTDFKLDFDNMIKPNNYRFKTHPSISEYKGFMGHPYIMPYNEKFNQSKFVDFSKIKFVKKEYNEFTEEEIQHIYDAIALAKSKGSEVLITVAPFLPAITDKEYLSFHHFLKEICDQNNVRLVDFNLLSKEIKLTYKDFRDASHVNNDGAKKASIYLGDYIRKNYNLPSRANDPEWLSEQPLTIESFIIKNFNANSIETNKKMVEELTVKSFCVFDDGKDKKIIIKVNDDATDETLSNYKFGVYAFAYDEDKENLSDYAKKTNKNYDGLNLTPTISTINGEKFIIVKIVTGLDKFSNLKFFLFDSTGFKGVIGETIETKNVSTLKN